MLEMRLLIFELHPPTLENEGLAGAIGTRLATVEARAGLETEMTVAGKGDGLSAEIEGALYRFAQEALNNVIKHSKAHNVRVRIQFETSFVTLEVADDGIGFDQTEAARTGGIGLRGMRERLERLGGRVVVQSAHGKGASLMAEVDL
jgi:signal transduction histidine kinase